MALAEDTVDILNEMFTVHYRSLPMYLVDATPWTHRGDQKAAEVLGDIVADQQESCRRIAEVIIARGGTLESGEYPTLFTDMHFLSLDFLLRELIRLQQLDIDAIQRGIDRLGNDPPAQALIKESLGAAKGYLQSLEELIAELSAAG
jgi:hypothetical protein